MSVFCRLYDCIDCGGRLILLIALEREEGEIFGGIAPIFFSDMRRPFSDCIKAIETSSEDYGIYEAIIEQYTTRDLNILNDRWHFKRLPPADWIPRAWSLDRDIFNDIRTAGPILPELDDSERIAPIFLKSIRNF